MSEFVIRFDVLGMILWPAPIWRLPALGHTAL
jgi:hypothetical protein